MESGDVVIARQEESVTLPARGIMVLACNPCPCGDYAPTAAHNHCTCTETQRRHYRRKFTGPITDRIDIVRHVVPLRPHDQRDRFQVRETSAEVRARVAEARDRQQTRYADTSWRLNGQAPGPVLSSEWPLARAGQRMVDDLVYEGKLSRRGAVRVHRLAWTVADLRGVAHPGEDETDVALRLRRGEPLLLSSLEAWAG
ncbi:MAG: ATP-binding protein [Nocardioides sp.]|nr:ATP-binding protein [Nocardioides sp.]